MKKNITMSDIAKKLNVSTVTVSKALSDKEGVSDDVRRQIKEKAELMGYRYNASAKAMKEGLNYNVGILVADRFFSDNAFYSALYKKIISDLGKKGYSGIVEIISQEEEKQCVTPNMAANNKVDGIIILGQTRNEYLDMIANTNIPYIFLDFYDEHLAVDAIVSDSVYGAYLLTNHLIMMGHQRIGFIGSIMATSSILDRYLGYYKALLQNGLDIRTDWIIEDRDEHGHFIDFKFPDEMPTAFVCNCDEIGYLAVDMLKKQGFSIPEDISIVGFDDHIYATLCVPNLTTFRVNMEMMGETAVDAIVKKMKNKSYTIGRKVISGDLIIRDSVKALN